jgi:hypothetical protein
MCGFGEDFDVAHVSPTQVLFLFHVSTFILFFLFSLWIVSICALFLVLYLSIYLFIFPSFFLSINLTFSHSTFFFSLLYPLFYFLSPDFTLHEGVQVNVTARTVKQMADGVGQLAQGVTNALNNNTVGAAVLVAGKFGGAPGAAAAGFAAAAPKIAGVCFHRFRPGACMSHCVP